MNILNSKKKYAAPKSDSELAYEFKTTAYTGKRVQQELKQRMESSTVSNIRTHQMKTRSQDY